MNHTLSAEQRRAAIESRIPWANAQWAAHECMRCGDGWLGIVEKVVDLALARGWKIKQIKEKLGHLVVHHDAPQKEWDSIHQLEDEADSVCELCGSTDGVTRAWWRPNYIRTLCQRCKPGQPTTYPPLAVSGLGVDDDE